MSLSSRERVLRSIRHQPTDCVAVAPYMYDVAVPVSGVSLLDFYTIPEAMVKAQLALHDALDQDVIAIGSDNFYIAEGFGCQTTRDPDELPALTQPAVDSLADVFKIGPLDPTTDGRMPVMIEAIRQTRQAVGDAVAIRSPGTGPFALASYLVGSQQWLYEVGMFEAGMNDEAEAGIQHALEIATESLIRFGKACWDAGADVIHCGDSLSSCDMISPKTYERFALPYQKKVFRAWKDHGITGGLLHICGNSTKVLDLYADSGAALVEIDNVVDLSVAKQRIGDRVTIQGNVHTVNDLLQGNPESMRAACQKCIKAAAGGGGFILGSGCIVPRNSPLENLKMMVQVARETRFEDLAL
ncbi:uroporphyrinogen decarboxylase family protein [Novipirellula artificiosorum]|uniref:Uroporphyrinogen decarboxylase n=1 Tax=Novipirellula artificiosorum TaxID=2528016 RepID=A0A5C6DSH7_9BACT|nr:uroporphyrinogen decarboxylase family protein [Novipirellula artificiosorum]TWU39225.1 Uroporphyrinogen decarboxylase [Novipirellula artificiosorum]